MGHVPAAVEKCRLAENDELLLLLQQFLHPFDAVEPDQLKAARLVREVGDKAFGALLAEHLRSGNPSPQLDVASLLHDVSDMVNMRFVHMTVGIIVQQVAERADVELLLEHFSPLGPHPLEELDRGLQQVSLCSHCVDVCSVSFFLKQNAKIYFFSYSTVMLPLVMLGSPLMLR